MKHIRNSKLSRIVACYLAIQLILTTVQPANLYALTGGPAQPEFNSFTPIGTSDMVDLSSGDFNYNLPIMDVGGYPLNLSYNSGVTMDQEASWVGLGWNLNVGQINRQIRGIPDDFNGDKMTYENNIRDNITVGANLKAHPAAAGFDLGLNLIGLNLGIEYNNYNGFMFKPSAGISFNMASGNSIGFNFSTSTTEGPTISPYLSLGDVTKNKDNEITGREEKSNYGFSFNSRQGVQNVTVNNEITRHTTKIGRKHGKPSGTSTFSFSNQTYTPTKRTPYINSNFAYNAALGTSVFFADGQAEIYAYAGMQAMQKDARISTESAYGYEHTDKATKNDILDFNRENDRVVGEHTATLAVPNYTYDIYSINGQGISGGFRPYRSQVGYVFDKFVKDKSKSTDIPGIEVGAGGIFHVGTDFKFQPSSSSTGLWEKRNNARGSFAEQTTGNNIDYEKVYFRNTSELSVDSEMNKLFYDYLGGNDPIRIPLNFINPFDVRTVAGKYLHGTGSSLKPTQGFDKVKRKNRLIRNQAIQKLTKKELKLITGDYTKDNKINIHSSAKNHHTNAIHVTKKDGSRYIYNQPIYNLTKVEASFNVGAKRNEPEPNADGTVGYNSGDNTIGNENGKTHFYSKTKTPAYAHAYLLTSVLSNDYQDLTGDGPTDDDLGNYTKFKYKKGKTAIYDWRVPIGKNKATYNEGLYSSDNDATANYTYGKKELKYVERIETKTHVAILKLSPREDALGVKDENGGKDLGKRMMKLDEVALYSKPEAIKALLLDDNPDNDKFVKPIKKATFIYDYSLCKGIPNHVTKGEGKLTLKEVYFTYRGSNMGRYMPYKFTYEKDYDGNGKIDNNPNYNVTHYNIWGNYKKDEGTRGVSANSTTTNEEFPYVEQDRKDIFPNNSDINKNQEDINAASWSLTKIDLPSGGDIDIDYESDDYKYVQNKRALQMFKVTGVGKTNNGTVNNTKLYGGGDSKYVYIKVRDKELDKSKFIKNYIGELREQKIYFRFLVNMVKNTNKKYDFVTGYMNLGNLQDINVIGDSSSKKEIDYHIAIPFERVRVEGGLPIGDDGKINPFSKAGWNFGRTYLNRLVHSMDGDSGDNKSLKSFVDDIIAQIGQISTIFRGPNRYLMDKRCANSFRPNKSFIRLQNPNGKKLGGGVRVAKIEMNDNWGNMTGNKDNPIYNMKYGQEYNYNNVDGTSSGVATYEPSLSKENPLVMPFEDADDQRFLAPSTRNYVEGPLGASFFPSPQVTYGRVEVKNLSRERKENINGQDVKKTVSKHATGKVVSEFYTSKDFPTITKHTPMSHSYKTIGESDLTNIFALNIFVKRHLAMSQGFSVELNDMNGKQKGQKVFAEGASNYDKPISEVEYKYHVKDGKLDNEMVTYDSKGITSKNIMGVQYDVVNDFRTSINRMKSFGADINVGGALIAIFPFIIPMISNVNFAMQNSDMRSTATVKVIHKKGILKEKIAKDNGASVFTKNLAYDKATGDVLLTETTNEYGDSYYNLNYPAYWAYEGMGHSTKNLDVLIEGVTYQSDGKHYPPSGVNLLNYLSPGDQLSVVTSSGEYYSRVWVSYVYDSSFFLIDENGNDFSIGVNNTASIKVLRSGYKNMQSASMASVTSMKNPLIDNNGKYIDIREDMLVSDNWNTYKVINTSGVEYQHKWSSQCEFRLPNIIYNEEKDRYVKTPFDLKVNTFLYNLEGNWKAKRSYAYLTGRHNGKAGDAPNPRNTGFLIKHKPFYTLKQGKWVPTLNDNIHKWTYASEVTQFSPYGAEIENKDALNRYSSAQYGYRYTLPVAVASNTKYNQLAFDGFEDYDYTPLSGNSTDKINPHFGFHDAGVSIEPIGHSGKNSLALSPNSSAEIAFQIHCGNDDYTLPKAVTDRVDLNKCNEGQTVIKMLSNDTFELKDKSKGLIEITVSPKLGTTTINNNGTPNDVTDDYINYKYASSILEGDTFEYKICNEIGQCSTAKVEINCDDGGNDSKPPKANGDNYTFGCSSGKTFQMDVLENDNYFTLSKGKLEVGSGETFNNSYNTGNGYVTVIGSRIDYVIDDNNNNPQNDSFQYRITNEKGESSIASVNITCLTIILGE